MFVKIHQSYRTVVAVCDRDLIGKKLEDGKRQLDVSERFFKDQTVSEAELETLLQRYFREDSTFNIVGHTAVTTALKAGIVDTTAVMTLQGIPFVLIL
jgi:hypothetical protein